MAKNQTRSLAGKKFVSIVVLSVAALGLMVTTMAVQRQTSTESKAATDCNTIPQYNFISSTDYPTRIVYELKARNVNYTAGCANKTLMYYLKTDTSSIPNSSKWTFEYTINGQTVRGNESILYENGDVDKIKLKVTPPASAAYRTYYFTTKACKIGQTTDGLKKYTDNCNSESLKYIKKAPTPSPAPTRPYNY